MRRMRRTLGLFLGSWSDGGHGHRDARPLHGQARGFGFVEIYDDAAAQQAVDNCHQKDMMGRVVVVNEVRPMATREGGKAPRG